MLNYNNYQSYNNPNFNGKAFRIDLKKLGKPLPLADVFERYNAAARTLDGIAKSQEALLGNHNEITGIYYIVAKDGYKKNAKTIMRRLNKAGFTYQVSKKDFSEGPRIERDVMEHFKDKIC